MATAKQTKIPPNLTEEVVSQMADALAAIEAPVVSSYVLAQKFFLLQQGEEAGTGKKLFHALVESLHKVRLLTPLEATDMQHAYQVFGRSKATPAEIVCGLDPFAYVSHLSAMEHHGLTDRFPQILYMTRPTATDWRSQAKERMAKDLGDRVDAFIASGLPRLTQPKINRIGSVAIHFCERSQLGAFRLVPDSSLRVATIGRVFLDMLREPVLCGGIQHVIDIYRAEAGQYFKLIVDEVDRHGQPIDKVRTGYVLTEVCSLHDERVDSWQKFAQRGGSRKLDPDGEYVATYSERWMLSINVPSLTRSMGGANG